MTEDEKNKYELVFSKIEQIEKDYLDEIIGLLRTVRIYDPKSQEFGLLVSALVHGKDSIHDLDIYIKILRNKIHELRLTHDS